ncbi:MAG: glycosyltransferase, partial [Clostridia bacterium]
MQKSQAVVSVIVPVYNSEKTIERCMNSILAQSYLALEVLAVDDGSTDQSLSLLKQYAEKDTRVRVLMQANAGVSSARNLAINNATGVYVQFVDSDDTLPTDATESLVHAIETPGCNLAIAAYTEVIGSMRQRRGFLREDMVLGQFALLDRLSAHPNSCYYAVLWNKLYRRDVIILNSIRCDSKLPWGEDFAFNTCYYQHVNCAAVLDKQVYEYARNPNGLTVSTACACLVHPIASIKVKFALHSYYKQLYVKTGLYEQYKHVLPQYLFKVTINN